ncbi:hypothetical protein EYF80_055208 [Liparis tanakae]|uniref:Uncharacterized protein n=1 Tax=Liparis tanakae TaxID=230148 RepID=A0A4Z2F2C0_9TELE|nr:hypothetical protein EYF80_055208 [Liparis tanakae]
MTVKPVHHNAFEMSANKATPPPSGHPGTVQAHSTQTHPMLFTLMKPIFRAARRRIIPLLNPGHAHRPQTTPPPAR